MGAGKKEFVGVPPLECGPPARPRRAAGEVGATNERLRSEGVATEAAWSRAQPADGGLRHGARFSVVAEGVAEG